MERIPLITAREQLEAEGREAFHRISESRGEVSRPFQLLLHAPAMARGVAELGHVVRFESHLRDADRELIVLATGRARGCAFVWESHVETARAAGVRPESISALEGNGGPLEGREGVLVSFVDELCGSGFVSDDTFRAALELLGITGTVELALTIGYYSMLGAVMRACEAC